ncbi:formate dehydrogenase [Pseudorhizobium endolithicum]|uniref:Formate dehydrogenase n=1 Tax=Pseudorhizobium endolithicum TaxID=1191678 RepID=A0ABN7JS16_9HYPH|nr:formate dehydrogenase subunit delta [Pseudorhizobium endolithicum]CAD6432187.1 formate dehydrogenase [Rhizobium sp. Q54]CAD7042487.1 formate dehydrogenase [Pseudorhizobium endolithicum]
MSHDQTNEKLVRMANQIATFFLSQSEDVRAEGVATHINKFWEPRMRRHLFEHLDAGGEGLLPLVIQASTMIRRPEARVSSGVGIGQDAAEGAPGGKGVAAGESLSEPSIPEA